MDFDLKLAEDCASSFSEASGLGCMVSSLDGTVLYRHGFSCADCKVCSALRRPQEECRQAHIYSTHVAERLGGRYIYFCTMGLTCFTSPIIGPNGAAAKLTVGPFLMVDRQDYAEYDLAVGLQLSPEEIERVMPLLEEIPYMEARRVTPLSQMLFLATGFLNNVSQAERMVQSGAAAHLQDQVSTYIHALKESGSRVPYPIQQEKNLLRRISKGDHKGAEQQLKELLGHLYFSGGVNAFTKDRLSDLLTLISRNVINCGAGAEAIFAAEDRCRRNLAAAGTMEACTDVLTRALHEMMDAAFRDHHIRHGQIVHSSIQYIQFHYAKKITLEDIAAHVSVSASYLSRVFKREIGQPIMLFLNRVRIEKSQELLTTTDWEIARIAAECGFEDQSYYTKVFKRHSGCTPHQYRKHAKAEQA